MVLNENAKLNDIISVLGDMQGINQKAELASVIGAPAVASDNIATQITKLQGVKSTLASNLITKGQSSVGTETLTSLVNKVADVNTGKKFASGIVNYNSSTFVTEYPFVKNDDTAYYSNRFEITGLNFTPSFILFLTNNSSYSFRPFTLYAKDFPFNSSGTSANIRHNVGNTLGGNEYALKLTGNAYVTYGSFGLPIKVAGGGTIIWVAYE